MDKPAILIYKDGRINPTMKVYDTPVVKLAECRPLRSAGKRNIEEEAPLNFPILHRTFRLVGNAGPYSIYEEVY